jgi:cell division protein FtsB
MIQMPQRSVTRFFIPLIDVLTLLFCIYLLMPIVQPTATGDKTPEEEAGPNPAQDRLSVEERVELEQLRKRMQQLEEQIAQVRRERAESIQQQLVLRVLQIDSQGRLFYHDARRPREQPVELTSANVRDWLDAQKQAAAGKELYVLILYPPVPPGSAPTAPSEAQKEDFERWFQGIAHGYDIPIQPRGG